MDDLPIKKFKKIYTGIEFNSKYKNLIKVSFEDDDDLTNKLVLEGEFEKTDIVKQFKFETYSYMYIRNETNKFIKYIYDVVVPDDATVIVRIHEYKKYICKFFTTTKIKLINKREFWKDYESVKKMIECDKLNNIYKKYFPNPDSIILNMIEKYKSIKKKKNKLVKPDMSSKYKYTPALHIKYMLSSVSVDDLSKITNNVPDEIIQNIKENMDKKFIPTIKAIKQLLYKSEYKKYTEHIPEIINKLGYKVPVITSDHKDQIKKYFEEHKEKFIKTREPLTYYDFNNIIIHIIDKLNLDITLAYLIDK